jgi:type IV pilus assembly protein PilW
MRQRQIQGFSLVELLVAIAISMVAMVAITQSYSSTRQTSRLQGMQSRLTEDGHFALSMIQRIFTQAGYRAVPTAALPADRFSVDSTTGAVTVKFESDGRNQIVCNGSVPAAGAQTLTVSMANSSLVCLTSPSTTPESWIAPTGNSTEVRDFQVLLGVDTGPNPTDADYSCGGGTRDCIADDQYVKALGSGQTAAQIVAVKVCLVLRTEAKDGSVTKDEPVQNCSGDDLAGSQNDNQLYRMFRTTVLLRNR